MIDEISLTLLRIPLTVPYKLAFGPLTHFDTILARATFGGSEGLGEATILTGYTDETVETGWTLARQAAEALPGMSAEAAKEAIAGSLKDAPFTATALTTAIEMAQGHPALQVGEPAAVPLLAGINATDEEGIAKEMEAALAAGYRTVKIKAGFEVESDLRRLAFIQERNAGRALLRVDANQGYSREDGCRFASGLDPADIELLEQPCHAENWEAAEAVAKVTTVPLMLDESIYGEADIERAARIGAAYVKLKLMKCVSLDRLASGLERIRALGMEPVLGNGVASDIGCWMEACVARGHIRNAGEMNGFLRQAKPLARPAFEVEDGALRLTPGAPGLSEETLEKAKVAEARFGRGGAMTGVAV